MALTLSNTNYNGEVLNDIYIAVGIGNEVVEKGACNIEVDVSTKKSIPVLSQTNDPIGDYVAGAPSSETVTTTYAERSLDPAPGTLYETFYPKTFHDVWEKWKSVGDFTNQELNQELLRAILNRYQNGIGRQMSRLFWQGDNTLGAGNALNKFNGIITRALADGNVINPTPAGNITENSFIDILAATWAAIPDHLIDDDDFVLHVNTTDWKTMQTGNTKLKQAFVGVFGMDMETMYNLKKIKHFSSMKRHHILGARTTNDESSNLHMAVWVEPDQEEPLVDRIANNSKQWFVRIDIKADANYSYAPELVLYKPA